MASLRLKVLAVIQLSVWFVYADRLVSNRFDCGNGNTVPRYYLCDNDNDCGNWADERNCDSENPIASTTENHIAIITENPGRFDCGNGFTVPQRYLCDGDDDCRNGADERSCNRENPIGSTTDNPIGSTTENPIASTTENPEARFDCGNGFIVPQHYLCDGDNDCLNGADERSCNRGNAVASTTQDPAPRLVLGLFFNCGNNRFVRIRSLCDGTDDCGNFADEIHCNQDTDVNLRSSTGGVVTTMSLKKDASIRSPNFPEDYPHNLNLLWNVSTAPGHRIKVAFIVKELEDSRDCRSDRLSLYDGYEVSSSPLGVYCRHHEAGLPQPVVSSSNAMLVRFTSDGSISWMGFHLALSTVCGGTLVAQPSDNEFVSHPMFGEEAYGENISCDWIIKSRPEKNVQITFSDFDVGATIQSSKAEKQREVIEVSDCENSNTGNCVQYNAPEENGGTDFVEIYDGPSDSSKIIMKRSGDQTPPTITSRNEELLIRFRSANPGNFRGFRVVYQEV